MARLRKNLTAEEAAEKSLAICRSIQKIGRFAEAGNLLFYAAIRNEADPGMLIKHCLDTGRRVFLPVLIDTGRFEAREYTGTETLIKNSFGIDEPKNGTLIKPEELDFIVVPGLAFDRQPHRIGFGAGFYDRYLPHAMHAYKVGAAYAFQIVEKIQTEEHDFCLDAVVTEKDVFYRL